MKFKEAYDIIISESIFKSISEKDIESRQMKDPLALVKASNANNIFLVRKLLDMDVDVNLKNKYGDNALMLASMYGKKDIVKILLDKGIDVNARNKNGYNALMCASRGGHHEIARMLIDKGADVNLKNSKGENALMLASYNGHKDVVDMLKRHGAVNESVNESIFRSLSSSGVKLRHDEYKKMNDFKNRLNDAILAGDIDSVREYIDTGDDINAVDINIFNPIITAIDNNRPEILKLLLDRGATVDNPDAIMSPVNMAAMNGFPGMVEMLYDHGADLNRKSHTGKTALMFAIRNMEDDIAVFLINHGADVDIVDNEGHNAYDYAKFRHNEKMMELVKSHEGEI
jgi:ankyrin repeat protein